MLQCQNVGFLLSMESLLSTRGNELGMLEDTLEAVRFLSSVGIKFEVCYADFPNLKK